MKNNYRILPLFPVFPGKKRSRVPGPGKAGGDRIQGNEVAPLSEQMGFKSSMFGFDKKMVMDYIYKLGEETKRQEQMFNARMTELEHAREETARRAGEAEGRLEEVTAQLQKQKDAAAEAARLIQSLSDEIERQKRVSAEKEREIQIQNERCRQLQFKAESLECRSRKYEELSRNVGDILLAAKANAEEIVAKAREEADSISQTVTDVTIQFEEEYRQVKEGMALMKEAVMAAFDAMEKRMETLDEALAAAAPKVQEEPAVEEAPAQEESDFDALAKEASSRESAGEQAPSFFRPASQD